MSMPSANDSVPPSKTRKALRVLLWVVGIPVLILLAVLIVGLLVNLKDEQLSPQAQALMAPRAFHADPAKNGFYIVRAMDADASLDAWKTGRDAVELEQKLFDEKPGRGDYEQKIVYKKAPASTWLRNVCGADIKNCVEADLKNRKKLEQAMAENAIYLRRYEAMQQLPEFEEHVLLSVAAPFPHYTLMLQASDMALRKAVLDIADGHVQSGIERLEQNDRYLRRMLTHSSMLLSRMVVLNTLRKQARAVSELIEIYPALVDEHGEALSKLVQALSRDEQRFDEVFMSEAKLGAGVLSNVDTDSMLAYASAESGANFSGRFQDWLALHYYKRNATLNLFAQAWQPILENANRPASEYAQARTLIGQRLVQLDDAHSIPYLHYLSNPVGKILFGISISPDTFVNYMEKSADIDGYLRLVGLQIDMRRKKIAAASIPEYVSKADARFRSPYDQSPMKWDAEHKQLQFAGRQMANSNPKGGNVYVVQLK